mmetsp:Transcript_94152/g.269614  ORF Transcript_94152/g.269614 Transcript_94152/m.269614 type:complete len:94 (+) Transcript_94152:479-760(+)
MSNFHAHQHHILPSDAPQPTRRRAARGEGGDGKWRREIGRLSRDAKKEKLEDLEEEMEDRYSKVPEPSWSKRNRRKRGKTAAARREAAAVSDL